MTINEQHNSYDDPMFLSSSDHAALQLTARQFDGSNYLGWARSARMALSTKSKLGFIDGGCAKPAENSTQYQRWIRCDSMVNCWILNSLTADVAEGFSYLNSCKELWDELRERYRQINGPLLYQLRSQMYGLKQNRTSVSTYYTKLKRIYDELKTVEVFPQCTCVARKACECGLIKKFQDIELRNQLLQFLMGLDDDYDQLRGQILGMDPLPPINRAFFLVQQLERQRQISGSIEVKTDYEACAVTKYHPGASSSSNPRKDKQKMKSDKHCNHCKMKGHTIDQCFKLHGYPEWFKAEKGKGGSRIAAQVGVDTDHGLNTQYEPLDDFNGHQLEPCATNSLISAVTQEVIRALKMQTDGPTDSGANVNFAGPYH